MPYFIEELWIFSDDGIPLVEIYKNPELDNGLMGGFFSAIESFSKEVTGSGIKSIVLGDDKYVLTRCLEDRIILVCKTEKNVKKKTIDKFLDVIVNFFEELYSVEDVKNWHGDLSIFDEFKKKLEVYFKMASI
jgi:hypothetical protein